MSGQGGRGWQTVSEKYKGTPPQRGAHGSKPCGMLWRRALTGGDGSPSALERHVAVFLGRIVQALVLRHLQCLDEFRAGLPREDNLIDETLFGSAVGVGEVVLILLDSGGLLLVACLALEDVHGSLGSHHGNLGGGISQVDVSADGLARHDNVGTAVGLAGDERYLRYGGLGISVDNLCAVASILEHGKVGSDAFALSVYPGSQPTMLKLVENGAVAKMIKAGAIVKPAFCGPCFGAGDVPCNNGLSIRHTTRNFMSREGSKPGEKQIASVALMDARSIAATAINGGYLTSATEIDFDETVPAFTFDKSIYENRVYNGFKKADEKAELVYGPNIADWPTIEPLKDNLAMKVVAVINDPVTTTDELIPSGETSSYRSNPLRLAEFALSRKVPEYVQRAKAVKKENKDILEGKINEQVEATLALAGVDTSDLSYGSVIYAVKPGDGSAREQAASCQRVLGGVANLASEYATKRYRSNLINWGMIPFLTKDTEYKLNDVIVVKDVAEKLMRGDTEFEALLIREEKVFAFKLYIDPLTDDEKDIILKGCLINYYA